MAARTIWSIPASFAGAVRYAPLNENPDVARMFAAADELAALRGGTRTRVAQTKGMKDKTGGSMWAPF
jgi:hypothetical protein